MAKKLYGTDPDQVPTNADLGTMAYQDAEHPRLNNVVISGQPDDITDGTLLRIKRGPSESGTWATVAIEAQTANGNSRIAFVNDIEPSAADAHGMIDFEHQTNRMQFFVDGSEAAHFNDSGNLVFPNGQGIDFSASQGSGASSSLLDDYEEGTWTPSFNTSNSNMTLTQQTQSGSYTKVGNVVTALCYIQCSTPSTAGSGNLQISGFPFSTASEVCVANWNDAGPIAPAYDATYTHLYGRMTGSRFEFRRVGSGTAANWVDPADLQGGYMLMGVTYTTTA